MAGNLLISIVTPFLNVAPYLEEAIESVLRQSFGGWELILVDDGSDDAGPEIARRYARQHPERITVLEHPGRANRGISASRNLGAAIARGEWIACLDGDDVWPPDKLAEQVAILRRHPEVRLLLGASLYWRSWDRSSSGRDEVIAVGAPQDTVIEPPALLTLLYPLGTGAAPSMNTVLVHASALRRVGGWEEQFQTAYEDQALLTKLYLETPAYVSSACWDFYRQRADSCMALELGPGGYRHHRRRFLEWFEGYLRERDLEGTDVWRAWQRALLRYRRPIRHRISRLSGHALDRIRRFGRGA